ncbi:MAG TPA: GTPase Era [Firmicutes bacterium]|nr:GTPase Era [Bacillota bacterium]
MKEPKSIFISIVGRPNVGKSSLMNYMCGKKISIVTDKPQTTRTRIMGVLTKGETQLVFLDTPGLHKPRTNLGEHMVKAVSEGMSGVDCCILVAYAGSGVSPAELEIIERLKERHIKAYLALNKIDLIENKEELLGRIAEYSTLFNFEAVLPISALTGDGVDILLNYMLKEAKPGPHYFPDDALTDQPERVMAAEIIREKMLLLLDKEIPHGIAVCTERFSERESGNIIDIEANIYCEKESHKRIIIGKGGSMLKRIGTMARGDMEGFFGCRINLQLWVKVKENWRNREGLIRSFGFE